MYVCYCMYIIFVCNKLPPSISGGYMGQPTFFGPPLLLPQAWKSVRKHRFPPPPSVEAHLQQTAQAVAERGLPGWPRWDVPSGCGL